MNKQQGSAHVWVVAVLMIGLIGALGFIFWQNFIEKDGGDKQATVTKLAEVEDKSVAEPATRIFESNTFSFKYPAEGWNAKETSYDLGETIETTPEVTTLDYEPNVGMGIKTGAMVSIFISPANSSVADMRKNAIETFKATEMKDTTVSALPAISYRNDYEGTRYSTYFVKDNLSYQISYQFAGTDPSIHRTGYDTVVTSFKFK